MTVTFDNSQLGGTTYTVGAGTDPFLIVCTYGYDVGGNHGSLSYDGVPMNLSISLGTVSSGASYPGLFIFSLWNPPTGASHSFTGTHQGIHSIASYHGARSIYPVYQSTNGITSSIQEVDLFITPDTSASWVGSFGGQYSSMVSALTVRQSDLGVNNLYYGDSNSAPGSLYEVAVKTVGNQYYQYCEFLISPTAPPIQVSGAPFFLKLIM